MAWLAAPVVDGLGLVGVQVAKPGLRMRQYNILSALQIRVPDS
jgi:hypothetical protein